METRDEMSLLLRLKAGDEDAFAELIAATGARLLAVARRLCRSEADAEDAVQEAFLAAFRSLDGFDGRSSLATWLHRIVVNAALMKHRRDQARPEVAIEDLLPAFTESGRHRDRPLPLEPVTSGSAHDRLALQQALSLLPEDFRHVLVLRDIEGYESKEIAATLGISDALVRQRLHRGRLALMRLLEGTSAPAGEGKV